MTEEEKQVFIIGKQCWLTEKKRLQSWIHTSGASRTQLKSARQLFKNYFAQFPDIDQQDDEQIYEALHELSSFASDSKRASRQDVQKRLTVQIPCPADLLAMKSLPAAGRDRQDQRLAKIADAVRAAFPSQFIVETQMAQSMNWIDRLPWLVLFEVIRTNRADLIDTAFHKIPSDNVILMALLSVHDKDYLLKFMHRCAGLSATETAEFFPGDADVLTGQLTFEALIHDIITTFEQRRPFNISFGLPTHHAHRNYPSGFCLINKIAVIIAYERILQEKLATRTLAASHLPVHHLIIGLDINRDDGLSGDVMNGEADFHCTHLDVYDSRVYPYENIESIRDEWSHWAGTPIADHFVKSTKWNKGNRSYESIDLAENKRKHKDDVHPAIRHVITALESILVDAKYNKKQVCLYMPIGWDSHVDETAGCSMRIRIPDPPSSAAGTSQPTARFKWLSPNERHTSRFNDKDWEYFNKYLNFFFQVYGEQLTRVYWQLEGGYNPDVNHKQVQALASAIVPKELVAEASSSSGKRLRSS